ncbi:hypothetical protein JCM19275_964 [Nonlabens ulvanivorans]|uniref:Uncharacterized protein n=1 Tax=Nonlabens ulvanivorans TaxID=906888 RepID=A0A090WD43_NONUL|nr:hypothetical protein JCM19275_964 [Nonlabens ulvanivorans]
MILIENHEKSYKYRNCAMHHRAAIHAIPITEPLQKWLAKDAI